MLELSVQPKLRHIVFGAEFASNARARTLLVTVSPSEHTISLRSQLAQETLHVSGDFLNGSESAWIWIDWSCDFDHREPALASTVQRRQLCVGHCRGRARRRRRDVDRLDCAHRALRCRGRGEHRVHAEPLDTQHGPRGATTALIGGDGNETASAVSYVRMEDTFDDTEDGVAGDLVRLI